MALIKAIPVNSFMFGLNNQNQTAELTCTYLVKKPINGQLQAVPVEEVILNFPIWLLKNMVGKLTMEITQYEIDHGVIEDKEAKILRADSLDISKLSKQGN